MTTDRPIPTETDRLVGQRVGDLRTARGLSQTDLGAAIGATVQQVQEVEQGQHRLSAGRLREIAQLLDVPLAAFFEGRAGIPLTLLDLPGAGDLLHAYATLTPELRHSLLTLTQDLARATGRPGLAS